MLHDRTREIAFLGMFTALIAVLRPVGLGAVGIEPMWFALILFSRAMGPSMGLLLGGMSMTLSALITGGVGPWLPWQILSASLIGFGTGIIPRKISQKKEIFLLVTYSIVAAELYGFIMDLSYWPIALGSGTQLSMDLSLGFAENADRFLRYHFVGALAWDVPRAIFTATLVATTGSTVLTAIRRALTKPTVSERVTRP